VLSLPALCQAEEVLLLLPLELTPAVISAAVAAAVVVVAPLLRPRPILDWSSAFAFHTQTTIRHSSKKTTQFTPLHRKPRTWLRAQRAISPLV
jgi:hypothetical protein